MDGEIRARAWASRAHDRISVNLIAELNLLLRDGPCSVFSSDMRLRAGKAGPYFYPDLTNVCGEPAFAVAEFDSLLNPMVIVEVLSPSTEAYDRGRKFEQYRNISSFCEYVLVSQDRRAVERFVRRGEEWVLTGTLNGEDDALRFETLPCEVLLRLIYAGVKFPESTINGPPLAGE